MAWVANEISNPLADELAGQGLALEIVREVRERMRGSAPLSREAEGRLLDGVVEALEDAQVCGGRIATIVKDLAIFGRSDSQRQRVRLVDVVEGARRWLPVAVARTVSITVEDGNAPEVIAAPGQMEQVVLNLVTNAARATPKGQRNEVILRTGPGAPGTARLEVIDHGIGIAPAILDRIFEPFFTTRPVGADKGTGLGLAICQAIVASHEGTLTVEGEVGKGSTFRIELPAAPA